jgi:hypothetical protein
MFSKKYLTPLIITLAAVTIGGAALAYNNFKPKNEVTKLTTTSSSSSSLVSKSEGSSTISKNSSVSSTSSTISQSSSSSKSSQTEIKKVPVEVESPVQKEPSETKSNPIQGSQPLAKVTKNIPSDDCTLPDLAGYDVLLTEKGCLYFKQKFEGNNYAWEWSPEFVAKDRSKLTKTLQDIAGIQYDKYIDQMRNKNSSLVIRSYVDNIGLKTIVVGFDDPLPGIARDWFDYEQYFVMLESESGEWLYIAQRKWEDYNCKLSGGDITTLITVYQDCILFSERYACDKVGNLLDSNLKELVYNEARNLYFEYRSKIKSENYYTGMICQPPLSNNFDFQLEVPGSYLDLKYVINYNASLNNGIWNVTRKY